jgi:hypothetical protein
MRTAPVNQSDGPVAEGWEPILLISISRVSSIDTTEAGGSRTRPYDVETQSPDTFRLILRAGGFFAGFACVSDVDGFDFKAVLVHVKALLAIQ